MTSAASPASSTRRAPTRARPPQHRPMIPLSLRPETQRLAGQYPDQVGNPGRRACDPVYPVRAWADLLDIYPGSRAGCRGFLARRTQRSCRCPCSGHKPRLWGRRRDRNDDPTGGAERACAGYQPALIRRDGRVACAPCRDAAATTCGWCARSRRDGPADRERASPARPGPEAGPPGRLASLYQDDVRPSLRRRGFAPKVSGEVGDVVMSRTDYLECPRRDDRGRHRPRPRRRDRTGRLLDRPPCCPAPSRLARHEKPRREPGAAADPSGPGPVRTHHQRERHEDRGGA